MEKYVQFILFYHEPKTVQSINKEKKIMEKGKKNIKISTIFRMKYANI